MLEASPAGSHVVVTVPIELLVGTGAKLEISSSGWIRTSNPPVNSVMQVVGLAGSSCR